MFKNLSLLLMFTLLIQNVNSARILAIIPTPSYSHQIFFQQLWRELAIRGHDVVVITTDPTEEKLPNFREISIKESYAPMKKLMDMMVNENMLKLILQNMLIDGIIELVDLQMSLPQVQELLRNKTEHFDLVMVEHVTAAPCIFKYRFNCPLIGVSSMDALPYSHEIMGNAVHSVLYPIAIFPFQQNLTFLQRLIAPFVTNLFSWTFLDDRINTIARKHFGEDTPDFRDVFENTDMLFVNAHPIFSPVRPYAPATISLAGGIHMKPPKPLPTDLKHFMDNAKEGVIYFSLGSNVQSNELSLKMRQIFVDSFAQIPYKVLWKFEEDSLPGKPDNVKITKWAPQQDVLRHKNVKLFVTQGGLQSLEEALYSHVPLVVIPFFGDQLANAEKVASQGLGIILDRHNFNAKDFKSALLEVIENPMYRNKLTVLANRIEDEPMKPLDKAIWWTEYVLRHKGAKHLKGPRIPFYQYYYLDISAFLSFVVVALGVFIFAVGKLLIRTFNCMFSSHKKVKKS